MCADLVVTLLSLLGIMLPEGLLIYDNQRRLLVSMTCLIVFTRCGSDCFIILRLCW